MVAMVVMVMVGVFGVGFVVDFVCCCCVFFGVVFVDDDVVGGGGGDDENNDHGDADDENQETSTDHEQASHLHSTPSSENSIPKLVRPDGCNDISIMQQKFSVSDIAKEMSDVSESSGQSLQTSGRNVARSTEQEEHGSQRSPTYTEASTAVVEENITPDVGNISDVQSAASHSGSSAVVTGW